MLSTETIKALDKRHIVHGWSVQEDLNPMVVETGKGVYFWDADGNKYLDFSSALVNLSIGYQHPKVVQAIKKQAEKMCYARPDSACLSRSELARDLAAVMPGDLNHFFFTLADRLLEVGFGIVEHFIGPLGNYVDIIATYGDMGTQNGLLCSHKDYVTFIKPYEKEMIAHIKKYTSAKIYRHSCGSVYEVIPDFIENEVEILNPVQPLAKHMEPWRLKKEFGKDLTFCGGIDTQELLCNGTPHEVKEAVRHTIRTYAPGGGYILGPAHSFEPDVPPENIVAMYDAAYEYGGYPIA